MFQTIYTCYVVTRARHKGSLLTITPAALGMPSASFCSGAKDMILPKYLNLGKSSPGAVTKKLTWWLERCLFHQMVKNPKKKEKKTAWQFCELKTWPFFGKNVNFRCPFLNGLVGIVTNPTRLGMKFGHELFITWGMWFWGVFLCRAPVSSPEVLTLVLRKVAPKKNLID